MNHPPDPAPSTQLGRDFPRHGADPRPSIPLAVNRQEIVRGHQGTDGWSTVEGAMAALPIVVIQPDGQGLGAVARARVGPAVRPLAQEGLDEALGLAIRARGVGARAEVAHAQAAAEAGKPGGDIAGAIVGQDAPDAEAVAPKPGASAPPELRRRHAALIAQHFDVGQPGGIVDRPMHVLPPDAPPPAPPIAADAVPHAPDPPEFLDIEMP